jgi:hypothetical protein
VGTVGPTGAPGWGTWFDATPVKLERAAESFFFGAVVVGVALDTAGRLFVLGNYDGKFRINGKQLIQDSPDRVGGTFVARFDPGGALRWYKMGSYPERPDPKKDAPPAPPTFTLYGEGLCTTKQGRVVIVGISEGDGEFANATLTSVGERSLFVSVRDGEGAHVWTEQFAAKGELWFPRVVAAGDGSLFLAGATSGEITFGETTVKADSDADEAKGGGHAAALFAARIDSDGKVAWAKRLGTVPMPTPIGLSADPSGGFVVSASVTLLQGSSTDLGGGPLFDKELPGHLGAMAVASYSADGAHRWSRGFTTLESNRAGAVAVTPSGRVVAVGTVNLGECLVACETKQLGDVFVAALGR